MDDDKLRMVCTASGSGLAALMLAYAILRRFDRDDQRHIVDLALHVLEELAGEAKDKPPVMLVFDGARKRLEDLLNQD